MFVKSPSCGVIFVDAEDFPVVAVENGACAELSKPLSLWKELPRLRDARYAGSPESSRYQEGNDVWRSS